jgi:hypothetical protein
MTGTSPLVVMAGFDLAIHGRAKSLKAPQVAQSAIDAPTSTGRQVDARVKPGHDGKEGARDSGFEALQTAPIR